MIKAQVVILCFCSLALCQPFHLKRRPCLPIKRFVSSNNNLPLGSFGRFVPSLGISIKECDDSEENDVGIEEHVKIVEPYGKNIQQDHESFEPDEPDDINLQQYVESFERKDRENFEENGDDFEGDMILSNAQLMDLHRRSGMVNTKYRWPNNTVPYQLSKDFTEKQANLIRQCLDVIEEVSCLRFVIRKPCHKDFVNVTAVARGCFSQVGHQGGSQVVNLSPNKIGKGCFRKGTVMHEFYHALGFFHMHSASDRDEYVEILWKNIKSDRHVNFKNFMESVVTNFGTTYDYDSMMHYNKFAFSVNGKPTLVPKKSAAKIGQRERLSKGDIVRLNRMYNCNKN